MNSQLKNIIQIVHEMGPRGGVALRAISNSIGPMLSAGWISHQFPGDVLAPTKSRVDMVAGRLRPRMRERLRAPEYSIDELSLETRYQFVRSRPKKTLVAILHGTKQGIEAALSVIKSDPEARGGAPLTYRRYMLANLAKLWRSIGKETPTSPQSEFALFCECVCECVGWPERGVGSAIQRPSSYCPLLVKPSSKNRLLLQKPPCKSELQQSPSIWRHCRNRGEAEWHSLEDLRPLQLRSRLLTLTPRFRRCLPRRPSFVASR